MELAAQRLCVVVGGEETAYMLPGCGLLTVELNPIEILTDVYLRYKFYTVDF